MNPTAVGTMHINEFPPNIFCVRTPLQYFTEGIGICEHLEHIEVIFLCTSKAMKHTWFQHQMTMPARAKVERQDKESYRITPKPLQTPNPPPHPTKFSLKIYTDLKNGPGSWKKAWNCLIFIPLLRHKQDCTTKFCKRHVSIYLAPVYVHLKTLSGL